MLSLPQGLGISRQGKWLLKNRRFCVRERSWIFSSETATAFLSFPENRQRKNQKSELFAMGPVQFSRPRGVAENSFTKPGFWKDYVVFS